MFITNNSNSWKLYRKIYKQVSKVESLEARTLTLETMNAVTVMALAVTLALPVAVGAIVRANLNLTGLARPRGVTCTHTIDANTMAGTVDMRIPADPTKHVHTEGR